MRSQGASYLLGFGAGKPLSMRVAHQSEDWAFLMWQLGMIE